MGDRRVWWPTDRNVERISADVRIPAHASGSFPVRFDRGTLGQENDCASSVGHEDTGHDRAEQDLEPPGILDPEEEEADGDLEQAGSHEEEELDEIAQHIDVDEVIAADVHLVPAIAMLDLHGLYRRAGDHKDCGDGDRVVVPTQISQCPSTV